MLPAHYQYGNWPASGEIDLVESRGNGPEYPPGGYDKVASTLHWGKCVLHSFSLIYSTIRVDSFLTVSTWLTFFPILLLRLLFLLLTNGTCLS